MFRIKKIEKDNKIFLSEADLYFDIIDMKKRRRCIDAKTNNEMITMLVNNNYQFDFKKNKKCKTVNLIYNNEIKRIKNVKISDNNVTKSKIHEIGEKTHDFILSKVKKYDHCFDTILI